MWAFVCGCVIADPCNHPHHLIAFVLLAISSFIDMLDHMELHFIEEKIPEPVETAEELEDEVEL